MSQLKDKLIKGDINLSSHKFELEIDNKFFQYNGELDRAYFIEEIVWNTLKATGVIGSAKDNIIEVVLTYGDKKYYIVFGDDNKMGGEPTLELDTKASTEEQIVEMLSEQVIHPEEVFMMDINEDENKIEIETPEKDIIKVKLSNIDKTEMTTKLLIVEEFLSQHKWNIIGIISILILPLATWKLVDSKLNNMISEDTKTMEAILKKTNSERKSLKKKVQAVIRDTNQLKNAKDISDPIILNKKISEIY